jgi:hypothetical protein
VISRQKVVGWVLIVVSFLFIVYYLKARLLVAGPPLEKAEWLRLLGSVVLLMLGTANVRLAAMREQNRKAGGQNSTSELTRNR